MCKTAAPLSRRQANTLLSGRTAVSIRGGRNEACETQVTVAAPNRSPLRDVMTQRPFDSIRSVVLRFAGSMRWSRPPSGRLLHAPPRLDEAGDLLDRSEVVHRDVAERDLDPELRLELGEELDEGHRIQRSRVEQIG